MNPRSASTEPRRRAAWIAVLAATYLVASAAAASAAPRVVASILPIHSLVAGVMDGVGAPELIVRPGASPHTHSFRPSDARSLESAAVVFWVGATMEPFLAKPLGTLAGRVRIAELAAAPGIALLPVRSGGAWERDEHGHSHAPGAKTEAVDSHFFLDPENAKAVVRVVVGALAATDPANRARYEANAASVIARLDALDAEMRSTLAPVKNRPYIVFHDAYQYFERRYDLAALGSVTVSPERQPGAKRLRALRERIVAAKAVCAFAEPQFRPALLATVVEGTGARTGALDPEGIGLTPGPDAYFALIRNLARALADCLGG
ncbi:MAG: zinc ABC transporter substrate-binding protein [Rhodospirillales bacterium]|nr:zinc ABC transporter substrate-binding protein [Rhodospirillales bacterium]